MTYDDRKRYSEYYAQRSRRQRLVRAHTIDISRLTQRELEAGRAECPPEEYWRPTKRSECLRGPRPCPYVACKWNLYLDVGTNGNIKLNFPDLEPDEMPPNASCALDIAERGAQTLELVAALLNVTRERLRQIQELALSHLHRRVAYRRSDLL